MNLNPPSAIRDTSWIKPGKTTFPWWNGFEIKNADFSGGLNTWTMKYYIDFCAEHGIEYHSLDGFENIAWYGGTIVPYKGADITKSLPEINLPEVIAYARQKGVRLPPLDAFGGGQGAHENSLSHLRGVGHRRRDGGFL